MARISPLLAMQVNAGATLLPYGPSDSSVRVVGSFVELELEYAAIRKSAALFDQPHRGTLSVSGADRIEFLNRMVTQELKGFDTGQVRRAFWLNRKGRIDADLRLAELGGRTVADLDIHAVRRAAEGLAGFIIAEDAVIGDESEATHRLAVHGPHAPAIFETLAGKPAPPPNRAVVAAIVGVEVACVRDDICGVPGLELAMPTAGAAAVYTALLGFAHDAPGPSGPRLRPIGWHALNIARIEGGTPLYNIDFGSESLPHESGVLRDRVSFRKGCYLGQEVVARMESRGHSKRALVALRCEPAGGSPLDAPQPASGSVVFASDSPDAEPVGVVTSSAPSPLLSLAVVCFAAVKPAHAGPGTRLSVDAEGRRVAAVVQPSLSFVGGAAPESPVTTAGRPS
jgi:folate-binding protein YgfZ